MSQRTAFFDALTEELPDDAWGLRLQEELAAHLDDAVYFAALEGTPASIAEEQAFADLGSPNLILQEFRHAMTYKSPQAFFLHAIAAGLLATPLVYLGMIGSINVILALPVFGALFSYFLFALAPMLRHIDGRAMKGKIIAITAGLPTLLVGIPMIVSLFGTQVQDSDRIPLFISFLIGMLVTFLSAVAAAWEIGWEQRHTAKSTTILGTLRINALRILGFVAMTFVVLVLSMVQNAPSSMSTFAKVHFMVSSGIAAPNALVAFLSPVTAGWISGITLTASGLIALGFIGRYLLERKQKRTASLPWGWAIVALLTIPLVVFPPKANGIQNIIWTNIPHTNIAETIERSQLGPFYGMMKYVSQNQSDAFRYYVSQDDGMPLQVKQLPDHVFSLTDIQSVDNLTITAARYEIDGATMQLADIWCHWKNPVNSPAPTVTMDGEVIDQNGSKQYLQNSSPLYCSDLWVGDKEIFTVSTGTIDIASGDVTLSTNGDWMLFAHDTDTQENGTLSPEEVYLIDLR
jgi:hypothetical protein